MVTFLIFSSIHNLSYSSTSVIIPILHFVVYNKEHLYSQSIFMELLYIIDLKNDSICNTESHTNGNLIDVVSIWDLLQHFASFSVK
jgi:hypothetical protein